MSVGFIPKTRSGNIITSAELLEISVVPVPANQEAIRLAIQKGLDVSEIKDTLEKGDVTDILNADQIIEQKYKNMDQVWDIVSALCRAYFAEDVAVEDFPQLLKESIGLLNQVAGGEEVVPEDDGGSEEDPMQMAYLEKRFKISEKAGAVLSKKNKELINNAITSMTTGVSVLEELLKATDSSTEGDGKASVEDEITTKGEDVVVSFTADELIGIIKQNAKATDRGNETTLALINRYETAIKAKAKQS